MKPRGSRLGQLKVPNKFQFSHAVVHSDKTTAVIWVKFRLPDAFHLHSPSVKITLKVDGVMQSAWLTVKIFKFLWEFFSDACSISDKASKQKSELCATHRQANCSLNSRVSLQDEHSLYRKVGFPQMYEIRYCSIHLKWIVWLFWEIHLFAFWQRLKWGDW